MFRVTQRSMYANMVTKMNNNLSGYMDSYNQGATMKKVNKPSDDPTGIARIMKYRNSIERTTKLESNTDTALGWLQLADTTLSGTVNTVITSIRSDAEQAATSTNAGNLDTLKIIADNIREKMGSLLNAANTRYEDKSLFAGQNYEGTAFDMGLAVTAVGWGQDANGDTTVPKPPFQVTGNLDQSIKIRFPNDGVIADGTEFEYYDDGKGKGEWIKGKVEQKGNGFDFAIKTTHGSATLTLPATQNYGTNNATGLLVPSQDATAQSINVKAFNAGDVTKEEEHGTILYVRPAVVYNGDDNNATTRIDQYNIPAGVTETVSANFNSTLLVRFPKNATSTQGDEFEYEYSADDGKNWIKCKTTIDGDLDAQGKNVTRLLLPGGHVDITGAQNIQADGQLYIRPQRTDLSFSILDGQTITVNNVGKDIFGGIYKNEYGNTLTAAFDENSDQSDVSWEEGSRNVFEVVGRLIGYCETGNQNGIQRSLEALKNAQKNINLHAADIGSRENRIDTTVTMLGDQKANDTERMSSLEDIDVTQLMVDLIQRQTSYQTVLQSSSMIMQMNIMNYLS